MVDFVKWPMWTKRMKLAVLDVLHSGKWWCGSPKSVAGENVWALQKEFAEFQESKFAFCCTNGTHAIEIPLLAMGIGMGDEVIVPEMTFRSQCIGSGSRKCCPDLL